MLFVGLSSEKQKKLCQMTQLENEENLRSCSTPIRTMTERTKNSSATITPWNILCALRFRNALQK